MACGVHCDGDYVVVSCQKRLWFQMCFINKMQCLTSYSVNKMPECHT